MKDIEKIMEEIKSGEKVTEAEELLKEKSDTKMIEAFEALATTQIQEYENYKVHKSQTHNVPVKKRKRVKRKLRAIARKSRKLNRKK